MGNENILQQTETNDPVDLTIYGVRGGSDFFFNLDDLLTITSGYVRDGYSNRFSENVNTTLIEEALDQIFEFISIDPSIAILGNPTFILREFGDDQVEPIITGTAGLGANPIGVLTLMEFFRGTVAGVIIGTQLNPVALTGYPVTDSGFTVQSNQTYTVRVTDDQARTDTIASTYTFTYPFYQGVVDEQADIFTGITRAQILALGGVALNVKTKSDTTFSSSPTNARYCIMYPASYGSLTSILDNNSFETISDYDIFTYDIVGLDATTQSYKVYILKNDTTTANFTNQFKF